MASVVFLTDLAPCGFPSPAADGREESLDLQKYLIRHPSSTCCVRCSGDSMIGACICDGDILVVDRQVRARHRDIVLAMYDGAFLVKRLLLERGGAVLHSENPSYRDIVVAEGDGLTICGVVIALARRLRTV